MRPGDRERTPTVAEVVSKAAAITDPDGSDTAVRGLIDSFEDDDRPATAVDDLGDELTSTERGIDPEQDSPAAEVTVAAAIWLSTNPAQEQDQTEHVMREASRLYFHGQPPPYVTDWLAERGAA